MNKLPDIVAAWTNPISKLSVLILLLLLFPLSASAGWSMQNNPTAYAYNVNVLPPFGTVLINERIICPKKDLHQPWCLVEHQEVNSIMTIKGLGEHICYLFIKQDGSMQVDSAHSVFCQIRLAAASIDTPGNVWLPKHF